MVVLSLTQKYTSTSLFSNLPSPSQFISCTLSVPLFWWRHSRRRVMSMSRPLLDSTPSSFLGPQRSPKNSEVSLSSLLQQRLSLLLAFDLASAVESRRWCHRQPLELPIFSLDSFPHPAAVVHDSSPAAALSSSAHCHEDAPGCSSFADMMRPACVIPISALLPSSNRCCCAPVVSTVSARQFVAAARSPRQHASLVALPLPSTFIIDN